MTWSRGVLVGLLAAGALVAPGARAQESSESPAADRPASGEGAEAEPRSWRRVFPEGLLGERLGDLIDLFSGDEVAVEEVFAPSFFERTAREQLLMAANEVAQRSDGLEFVRVLRVRDDALGVELREKSGRATWTLGFELTEQGQVTGLQLEPQRPRPEGARVFDTFDEFAAAIATLPGETGAAVYRWRDGAMTREAGHDADERLNVAQLSSQWLINALIERVGENGLTWDTELTIETRDKSLPPSQYLDAEAGSPVKAINVLRGIALGNDAVLSDTLLRALGREDVEAHVRRTIGALDDRSVPFLSVRELLTLKLFAPDDLRERYVEADTRAQRELLADEVAAIDVLGQDGEAAVRDWQAGIAIDTVGWFFSVNEMARAMAYVREAAFPGADGEASEPVRGAMTLARDVLDPNVWPNTLVRYGGEQGVFSTAWMMERYDGEWFALIVIQNVEAGEASTQDVLRCVQGAVDLMAIEE
jgi:hypothetical protein